MSELPIDMREDGWAVLDLPGWEASQVALRVDVIDGAPRCTGVEILPREETRSAVLTVSRLRTLPLDKVARAVGALQTMTPASVPDVIRELDSAAREVARMPRGRKATSPEEVAAIYTRARLAGEAPRAAVCRAVGCSTRTADRYISEARRAGLLAPYADRRNQ